MSWLTALFSFFRPARAMVEVFKPNAEADAKRKHAEHMALSEQDLASLAQFASEFRDRRNQTLWDSLVDGLNRLPRPLITLGILGLFILAPVDPLRFVEIATAYEAVPEGLWALFSIIIAFYFGGRMQIKGQDMQLKGQALVAAKELAAMRHVRQDQQPVLPIPGTSPELPPEAVARPNRVIERWKRQRTA